MSGTTLRAALELRLEDKLTSGLNSLKGILSGLREVGHSLTLGGLGDSGSEALSKISSEARNLAGNLRHIVTNANASEAAFGRMKKAASGMASHIGAIGTVVSAATLAEPVRSYAGFENIARHSAITEGLSGAPLEAETQRLMAMFRRDALATSQSSSSIAQAYQDLIQTGIKPQLAEKLLPIHSRAATAYNISPEALGHAVFALSDSFKISDGDMGGALAAMALASKEGRFKVEDFSRFLPSIGGNMSKLGMTGRGSANLAFAALETVMKNSADPSTGATNFSDFMNYLTSPMAARSFALDSRGMSPETRRVLNQNHITGIDMPALLANARQQGIDPLSAVLGTLQKKLAGLPPDVVAEVLGSFFHNQQARDAALALLQHSGDLIAMRARLGGADSGMLDRDFASANAAPQKKIDLAMEQMTQLAQTAGAAFLPLLTDVNWGLGEMIKGLNRLDQVMPGAKNDVLEFGGGVLALVAGIGAVGMVWPAFAGGIGLLGAGLALVVTPLGLVVAAVVALSAAGYELYQHWQAFLGYFGLGPQGGPRAGLYPVGGRHNQFVAPAALGGDGQTFTPPGLASPALPSPDGPGRHTRAWYLQHKDDEAGTDVSMPAAASGNVKVTLGIDGDGKLIVKNATSDSPSVQVAAPAVNPGPTLGRP